ncbi:Protein CBG26566 [Caenorhabditis briggsae]|uniref:Protein CBG26566 n=1 Tax=Caenorhabditis briggsae TaxID=6238 RepID=B6IH00_CAEBR|nr:Protein CBG26566 [Caenorhabditis briggsae]CAR99180.1 Protein CBG26566 [Caenorhabditis briggsae]
MPKNRVHPSYGVQKTAENGGNHQKRMFLKLLKHPWKPAPSNAQKWMASEKPFELGYQGIPESGRLYRPATHPDLNFKNSSLLEKLGYEGIPESGQTYHPAVHSNLNSIQVVSDFKNAGNQKMDLNLLNPNEPPTWRTFPTPPIEYIPRPIEPRHLRQYQRDAKKLDEKKNANGRLQKSSILRRPEPTSTEIIPEKPPAPSRISIICEKASNFLLSKNFLIIFGLLVIFLTIYALIAIWRIRKH